MLLPEARRAEPGGAQDSRQVRGWGHSKELRLCPTAMQNHRGLLHKRSDVKGFVF